MLERWRRIVDCSGWRHQHAFQCHDRLRPLAAATVASPAGAPLTRSRRAPAAAGSKTRPERTEFRETSHYDDVVAFMEAAAKASPKIHLTTFGKTFEGRALPLAVVGAPDATPEAVRKTGKLRVYIQGNIHAGEVEGKESAQMLLRELAEGKHADWLQSMVLLIAPIYNADGNERFATEQPRPAERPGRRPGPASERAELRPQPRSHEARLARGARVREAADRLRPARHAWTCTRPTARATATT